MCCATCTLMLISESAEIFNININRRRRLTDSYLCQNSELHALLRQSSVDSDYNVKNTMQWYQKENDVIQSLVSWRRSICLLTCRHLEINSDLLFTRLSPSYKAISSFSLIHRLHLIFALLKGAHCFLIFHFRLGTWLARFIFHTSLESSVSFSYFAFSNDFLWLAYLFLKDGSHRPMYFFSV